jgi:hypothetical protein
MRLNLMKVKTWMLRIGPKPNVCTVRILLDGCGKRLEQRAK